MMRSCPQRQRCKQAPNTKVGNLASEVIAVPWENIFIDHVGPSPRSTKGNKYILKVVDAFSKFSILIPTKSAKAHMTPALLVSRVFAMFGPPNFLVSDNVSHFKSHCFKNFA